MADDTDVVDSLRAVAAWLYPPHPEPDPDDRPAVRALWKRRDEAAEALGEMAGWDAALLWRAVGEPVDDDDDEEQRPGRTALVGAAMQAEHLQEPLEVSAHRLAHSALLGATVAGTGWADWVKMLATHHSRNRKSALELARDEVPFAALQGGESVALIARAQRMLGEALGRLA